MDKQSIDVYSATRELTEAIQRQVLEVLQDGSGADAVSKIVLPPLRLLSKNLRAFQQRERRSASWDPDENDE